MAQNTTASEVNLLKRIWPEDVEFEFQQECAFWNWVEKTAEGFGDQYVQTNPYYAPNNGSHGFTEALEEQTLGSHEKFLTEDRNAYVIGSIESKLLKRAATKKGAIKPILEIETKKALESWNVMMRRDIWRNKGGARGQISTGSTVASANLTLADPNDINLFHKGMRLQAASTDGTSGSLLPGSAVISAINRRTATITTAGGNWSTQITGLATSHYLFRYGDFGVAFDGVLAWVPTSDSGLGTTFNNVTRSNDAEALAGFRYADKAGKDIATIILNAAAYMHKHGGRCDTLWLNSQRWAELGTQLQSQGRYAPAQSSIGKVAFDTFQILGINGPIKVMSDAYCPYAYGLLTRKPAWKFHTIGDFPHMEKFAGETYFIEQSSDGKQYRLKGYGNLVCHRPIDNCIVTL